MVILRNAVKPVAWNSLADKGWWHCAANVRNISGHHWAPIFCAVLYCYTWTPHGPRLCWVKQVCRWIGALVSLIRYFGSILGGVLDSDRFFNSLSNVLFVHSQWSHYGHIGYIRSKIASENAWQMYLEATTLTHLSLTKSTKDMKILRWKAMNTGSFLLHLHQDALYWEYKYIIYHYIIYIYINIILYNILYIY